MPWTRRSRHQHYIRSGRDIGSTDEEVATSLSCRNIRCKGFKVVTSVSCRDINCKDLRSRHHSVVATSVRKNSGHDIKKLLRHQLQWKPRSRHQPIFATSAYKEQWSRHQSVVATSHTRKAGRDMIQLSRHQLQRMKGRDNSQRSRHPLHRPEGGEVIQLSRHQTQVKKVAISLSCRDHSSKR